jgi:DNA-directed RNA polymerase I, II, and III subunit RPABC2
MSFSDDESPYNSDSESSDSEVEVTPKTKKPIKTVPTIDDENSDDESDIPESENSDEEIESEAEEEELVGGAADSDIEEGEIEEDELSEDENPDSGEGKKQPKTKVNIQPLIEDDDEDDEYDENYLQKFDSEITKNYIADFHPECFNHNYEEVEKLSTVVRNSDNIIIDPLHKTIPFLTKYEKTRILGQRAKQIEMGAKPFVSVDEKIVDSYIIAELELREKKIPFIIKRPIPSGGFEYWNVKDLEMIV